MNELPNGHDLHTHALVCQPHLDAVSGPHPSDRLQVLQSAAQHHAHGLVTLLHLGQGLLVTQGSGSVVG